jgi:hypothetical protein
MSWKHSASLKNRNSQSIVCAASYQEDYRYMEEQLRLMLNDNPKAFQYYLPIRA